MKNHSRKSKNTQQTPAQLALFQEVESLPNWEHIRREEINGEMHYSILDIFKFYGDTQNYQREWTQVQARLEKQGFSSYTDSVQLHHFDGERQRPTPVATREVFFRIAQSTNFKNWEHIRRAMSQALDEKIESAVQKKMRETIEYCDSHEMGNRPDVLLLKGKYEASLSLTNVKAGISNLLTLTSREWANFHTVEIQSLLGFALDEIRKARNAKSVRDSLNVFEYNALIHAENDLLAIMSIQGNIDAQRLMDNVRLVFTPIGLNLQSLLATLGYDALTGLPLLGDGKG